MSNLSSNPKHASKQTLTNFLRKRIIPRRFRRFFNFRFWSVGFEFYARLDLEPCQHKLRHIGVELVVVLQILSFSKLAKPGKIIIFFLMSTFGVDLNWYSFSSTVSM